MAVDIAPELYEKTRKRWRYYINQNRDISAAMRAMKDGSADYVTAYHYAKAVGDCLADAFSDCITEDVLPDGRMYYNIADRVVRPLLHELQNMVGEFSDGAQKLINKRAGLGLNPVTFEDEQ